MRGDWLASLYLKYQRGTLPSFTAEFPTCCLLGLSLEEGTLEILGLLLVRRAVGVNENASCRPGSSCDDILVVSMSAAVA